MPTAVPGSFGMGMARSVDPDRDRPGDGEKRQAAGSRHRRSCRIGWRADYLHLGDPAEVGASDQALFEFAIELENICFSTFLLAEARLMHELREKFEQWEKIALDPLESLIREAQALGQLRPGASAPMLSVLVDPDQRECPAYAQLPGRYLRRSEPR